MATKTKIPTTVKTRGNRLTESTRKRYYVEDQRRNYTYKYGDSREYYRRKRKPVGKILDLSTPHSILCGHLAVITASLKVIIPTGIAIYCIATGGGIQLFGVLMQPLCIAFSVFSGVLLIFFAAGAAGSKKSKAAVWSLIIGYLADSIVYIVSAIGLNTISQAANGSASF